MPDMSGYEQARHAVASRVQQQEMPEASVILGTGLGGWVERLQDQIVLPYEDIPYFPRSTVQSHLGRLVYGRCGSTPVWVLQGRFHLYEGYSPEQVCMGVRLLGLLGVRSLVLTNASGAINPQFRTGAVMLISDQINMTGYNPLVGPNIEEWGPRFPDMSGVYDPLLRETALEVASQLGVRLEEGVYMGVLGPNLETPAETRAYKRMGADAVGMSTVMEAIAARHMGIRLLGLSCLTNKNLPDCMQETSLEEIVARAEASGETLGELLDGVIPRLGARPA
jgi:purine-nucleoside phosphorylase